MQHYYLLPISKKVSAYDIYVTIAIVGGTIFNESPPLKIIHHHVTHIADIYYISSILIGDCY